MNLSKRHHYIPQFYIKGFVGIDGKVSVFNKETRTLELNRKSPKQVFFEWNRNTFNINGENTDFLEKVYQFSENKFSAVYRRLTEKHEHIELTSKDLLHLILFIAEIHWRVPNQDKDNLEFIKNLTPERFYFKAKNKITGENATLKLFHQLIKDPSFIESYKIVRAIQNYLEIEKDESIKNWKLYFSPKEGNHPHLLSDNPLILRNENEPNILKSELIFPLSKSKCIYHTTGKTLKQIPPENRFITDILLFIQANKLVCGPDPDYLNIISNMASKYNA